MKILSVVVLVLGFSFSSAQAQEGMNGWNCKRPAYNEVPASSVDPVQTENQVNTNDNGTTTPSSEKQFSTPQGGNAPVTGEGASDSGATVAEQNSGNNGFQKACDQNWSAPADLENLPGQGVQRWTAPNGPTGLPFWKY